MRNKGTVASWQRIIINIIIIIFNNHCWNLRFRAGIQYYMYGFICLIVQNMGQHSVSLTYEGEAGLQLS